jgi:hypothetical protein
MEQSKYPPANSSGLLRSMRSLSIAGLPLTAIAFFVLTAIISLLWSSNSLLTWDEYLSLWTDRLPTLEQVVQVQRTSPISIDPLFYHLAAHTSVRLFGAGPFAMRLPSLVGYLIMQVCLFFFVRRIAGKAAATLAVGLPALSSAFYYSLDGRPYGLMLGFIALSILSWQGATRRESKRALWLVTLALSIALTVNVHYFGVLLLIPLCFAETCRALQRRSWDIPVLSSIAAGATGILGLLPFLNAASEFRVHYCCYPVTIGVIPAAYLSMFPHFHGSRIEPAFDALLFIAALLVLWSCFRQFRPRSAVVGAAHTHQFPIPEAILLLTLALQPFCGYLLALLTTKAMEPRYLIGALPGVTAILAIGLAFAFPQNGGRTVAALMFLAVTLAGLRNIDQARKSTAEAFETLNISPAIKAALFASATGKLYFQDAERFAFATYYEPDTDIRSRMALVYSPTQERKWKHNDTMSFNAISMRNFTPFDIEPYESISDRRGEAVFAVVDDLGWDWTIHAFEDAQSRVQSVGSAFGIDIVTVTFAPKSCGELSRSAVSSSNYGSCEFEATQSRLKMGRALMSRMSRSRTGNIRQTGDMFQ